MANDSNWTFFSNYGHVLMAVAENPRARLRDLAQAVGITERAVHRVLVEMEAAEVIVRTKEGRRVFTTINRKVRLRHPIESHRTVGDLIRLMSTESIVSSQKSTNSK